VPEVMLTYKNQIDRAYDLALGDAMMFEREINRMHRGPAAETVADRLSGIQSRGRDQSGSE